MKATEVVFAWGHENVQATHRTTLEITKDGHLSKKGNCIIAVSADKSLPDLSPRFVENLRRENTTLEILIEAGNIVEIVHAIGSPQLTLNHTTDMVIRKSSYSCDRTLAIRADKAACDLSNKLVEKLKERKKVKITLSTGN